MHPLLNTAVRAARDAGEIILRHVDRIDGLIIDSKARNDYVSEVDRLAEQEIVRRLRRAYPDHSILGEESGSHAGNDYQWIIDPLDGTTNFLHGIPHYAVSIGLRHKDKLEQGVVYDPIKNELFTATRGGGARMNDRRLRVSTQGSLDGALLGTGIPFRDDHPVDLFMATLKALLPGSAGIRRAGSAALDLAYVAAGRLDGYWEFAIKPWDMAAGVLLVEEAGGMVSDLHGGKDFFITGDILCGTPKVYRDMLRRLESVLPDKRRDDRT